jgi:hypothetical protein
VLVEAVRQDVDERDEGVRRTLAGRRHPPILLALTATGLILVARLPGGRGR